MKIYIPTMGRENQWTLMAMPQWWRRRTTILCPKGDVAIRVAKEFGAQVCIQAKGYAGIAGARQQIIDMNEEPVLMLDDDLKFSHRPDHNDIKLVQSDERAVGEALDKVESLMEQYSHGSISTREGNNRCSEPITKIGRSLRALAYDPQIMKDLKIRFRLKVMEDFDVSLQLLRKGHPNFILWTHAQDQKVGSGAPGGCSSYRTPEVQAKAAWDLAALHPGFVKVVEKETKTGWKAFGGKRTDVIVYWKKAYESFHQPKFVIRRSP